MKLLAFSFSSAGVVLVYIAAYHIWSQKILCSSFSGGNFPSYWSAVNLSLSMYQTKVKEIMKTAVLVRVGWTCHSHNPGIYEMREYSKVRGKCIFVQRSTKNTVSNTGTNTVSIKIGTVCAGPRFLPFVLFKGRIEERYCLVRELVLGFISPQW